MYEAVFGSSVNENPVDSTNVPASILVVDDDNLDCPGATYTTIQAAINAATSGDTIQVCAGTYAENVTVNKSLTILGPNEGFNPNTSGTPNAQAIVRPATAETSVQSSTSGTIFRLGDAAGQIVVTIKGLTIDGNNPSLAGSGRTLNGVEVHTGAGIVNSIGSFDTNPGGYNVRMIVQNNIIRNLERYGVLADGVPATIPMGGTNVSFNKIDNLPSGNNFGNGRGRGVAFEENHYGTLESNVITRVNVGWQDDNYHLAAPGGIGTVVKANTIKSYHRGIFHNLQYQNATNATISDNIVSAETTGDFPASATNFGIELASIQSAVGVTMTKNDVSGQVYGLLLWNNPTTGNISISGGTLSGNTYGIYVTDTDPQFGSGSNVNANISSLTVTGNTNTGIRMETNSPAALNITANFNRIVGNAAGAATSGSGTINNILRNNFWGCNGGPGTAGCDTATSAIDFNPWLVLTTTASPAGVGVNGISTITADLTKNSGGATPTGGSIPDGTPVSFAATSGTINPTTNTLSNGTATATFTAGNASGTASVSSTVDNATSNATVTVYPGVVSITRSSPSAQSTTSTSVVFRVEFSDGVNNVDAGDFQVTTVNGSFTGAFVNSVNTSSPFKVYFVTVNIPSGNGELRLDLIDNNSIVTSTGSIPLGGPGAGNGNFTTGQTYIVDTLAPTVSSITRGGAMNPTNAANVSFTVTFSEDVAGVDTNDFQLTTTGVSGATITSVGGGPKIYTVNVNTGTGTGTIRLDVKNSATIQDIAGNAFTGGYTGGEVYNIDRDALTVTIAQAATQSDPTSSLPINFTVVFNKPVMNFSNADLNDVNLSGSASNGATYTISQPNSLDFTTYNVAVTLTMGGTITASIPAGAATDAAGNLSAASTPADATVTYLVAVVTNTRTNETFTTIQAAIDDSDTTSGDTIRASAGVYKERVNVTKSLTIQGAQHGIDARTGRADVNLESTVGIGQPTNSDPPAGAFVIQSAVTATIDGFRMVNIVRPDGDATAIFLSGGIGGHQVINNIFDGNNGAVYSDSPGNTFRYNRVNTTTNTIGTDAYYGGANGTTIRDNSFTGGYPNGAINTSGSTTPKTNILITNNTFQATGNFIVLFASDGAQVTGNTSGGTSSSTIFAGGGNINTNISGNTLNLLGGNGIRFIDQNFGYGANSNITIQNNTVTRSLASQMADRSVFDLRGVAGSNTVGSNTVTFSGTLASGVSSHVTRIAGSASGNFTVVGNLLNGGNAVSTGAVKPSGLYIASVDADDGDGLAANNYGALPASTVINVNCNTFNNFGDGVTVYSNVANTTGGLPAGIDVNINYNNFTSNSQFGINNSGTSETIDGTNNYWNSATGPTNAGNPGGTGDAVSANVNFTLFLTSASTCAPVNTVPGAQTVNQDTPLVFSGAKQISVADLDVLNNPVTITLSVTNGTLTLSGTNGLTFSTGDGTGDTTMTFSGTLANVNAALNNLTFNPTANFVGTSTLTLTSSSMGSPGAGSMPEQTDTDTVTISVLDAIAPTVTSIDRGTPADANTNATSVIFNVTFSESVTGVDATDFQLVGSIERAAATINVSADLGATRTVTVTGYTGDGTLGLNLVDNDSIIDAPQSNPLGGAGNGSFTGQTYTIDLTAPTVTINQALGQLDPTTASPVNFTVVFSEVVANTNNPFDNTDVNTSSSTAMISSVVVTNPSNDGKTYNVQITPSSSGTVVAVIAAGAATDAFGNGNTTPTGDNSVSYFTTMSSMVVDDDGAASPGNCDSTVPAPNNIQTAVNLSNPGDTITVCPGIYQEDVLINKNNLILNGSGAALTTVSGIIGGDGATMRIAANNVEVKNFTITREGNTPAQWNNPNLNSAGIAVQGQSVTNLSAHDNIISGNRSGIDINNSNGHTIRNNNIVNNRTGLIFRNQTDNITLVENNITDNFTVGIVFLDASSGTNSPVQTAANWNSSNNNISGNWYGQIVDRQTGGSIPAPGTTNLKNFSGNWFGTNAPVVTTANSNEPGYAVQIPVIFGGTATAPGGQPDIAGPASANVDYNPPLNTGTDTNVETTTGRGTNGFQGDFSSLRVVPTSASRQANGTTGNIQEGINFAATSGMVDVAGGSYTENININKRVSVLGPNAAVDPNTQTRNTPEATIYTAIADSNFYDGADPLNSTIVRMSVDGVTFKGFTLDGNNPALTSNYVFNTQDIDAYGGISGTGTIDPQADIGYNIVKNMGEYGIELYGDANAAGVRTNSTISHNKVDNVVGWYYGNGIFIGDNASGNVTDNVVTQSFGGVMIHHFNGQVTSRPNSVVSRNQLTTYGYPIWFNLHYAYSGNGFTVSENIINSYVQADEGARSAGRITPKTVSGSNSESRRYRRSNDAVAGGDSPDSVGGWNKFIGIKIESVNGSVPVTFSNNTVTPNRTALIGDGYTIIDGMRITNPSTTSTNISITGNTISGAKRGIAHTALAVPSVTCNNITSNEIGVYVGNGIDYDGNTEYATNGIVIGGAMDSGNNLVGNSLFGVQSDTTGIASPVVTNATYNYWGAANGPGPIGLGSGDKVSSNVDFSNFLNAPATGCATTANFPTVTIEQASGQDDPTNNSTINFTVTFSEPVIGFDGSDIDLSGTAGGTLVANITGGNQIYNVAVTGMTSNGTVVAKVKVGAAQSLATNNPSAASTSTDNTVTFDNVGPTTTVSTTSSNPTMTAPIPFAVVFSESVADFDASDVTVTNGTVTPASFTGSGTNYSFTVTPNGQGAVIVKVLAGAATDAAGNDNQLSNTVTITFDTVGPTATINTSETDGTGTSPIDFTVEFSDPVTGFNASDIIVSGTAFGSGSNPSVVVTPSTEPATSYNVAVSGMNQDGTVVINFDASAAFDLASNPSAAPTIIDNSVVFDLMDTAVLVAPVNTMGWGGFDDITNTFIEPTFVTGPTGQPLGVGSARIQTSDTGAKLLATTAYNGTRLDRITQLTYSSYQNISGNLFSAPSLQIGVDSDMTDAITGFQGRLVFEPYQNGTVQQNTWQTWNATNGEFWATQAPINAFCPQTNPCTRAELLFHFKDVGISNSAFGFIGFRGQGSGSGIGFDGNVDAFTIGVDSANKTFNFEPTPPTVSIGDVTVTEGTGGTTTATFTVTLSNASTLTATVDYATGNGITNSATEGSDYTAKSGTLIFTPNSTMQTVTVDVNPDAVFEGTTPETFTVNLSNAVNTFIDDAQGVGTINEDDGVPTLSIASTTPGAEPGTANVFTVTLTGQTTSTVTVNYATGGGTATADVDYTAPVSGSNTLSFPANGGATQSQTITIPTIDDPVFEGPENFVVTLSNVANATIPMSNESATGTIADNESVPTVSIDPSSSTDGAETGMVPNTFTVTLTGQTTQVVTVNYSVGGGTATAGSDYGTPMPNNPPYLLTFPANGGATQSQTITVPTIDDTVFEGSTDETFNITLTGATNATISSATGLGTITDNDSQPVFQVGNTNYSVIEGNSVTITVNRTGATGNAVDISYAANSCTPTATVRCAAANDYSLSGTGTLSFAAGETSKSFTVNAVPDNNIESIETLNLVFNCTSFCGGGSAATVSIADGGISIGGTVLEGTTPLSGVTISLAGSGSTTPVITTTTSATGTFSFPGLKSGRNYLVTPSLTGYDFDPSNRNYLNLTSNVSNANFQAFNTSTTDNPRFLSVVNGSIAPGGPGFVTINLNSQGNENALSFSLDFDNTRLDVAYNTPGNPASGLAVTCGDDAPAGCSVGANVNANGDVGIVLNLPSNTAFAGSAGCTTCLREAVRVKFVSKNTPPTTPTFTTPIVFGNSPNIRQVISTTGNAVPARYIDGLISVNNLESDVGPRFTGDGTLTTLDTAQAERFAARLDTPNPATNEFQRFDAFPAATSGDGLVTAGDSAQAARYAAGLDAPQPTDGPTFEDARMAILPDKEDSETDAAQVLPRVVRVNTVSSSSGSFVTVEILANTNADENAYGFSVAYDPTKLSVPDPNTDIQLGTGARDTLNGIPALTANANLAAQGRLGFIIQFAAGRSIQEGTNRQLLTIRFRVADGVPVGLIPIDFSNNPVTRQVVGGAPLEVRPTTFAPGGGVLVTGPTASNVNIGGRVLNSSQKGVGGATVILTDPEGGTRSAKTDILGRYRIAGVLAGRTYIVEVKAKFYSFTPQVLTISEGLTEYDLTMQEQQQLQE